MRGRCIVSNEMQTSRDAGVRRRLNRLTQCSGVPHCSDIIKHKWINNLTGLNRWSYCIFQEWREPTRQSTRLPNSPLHTSNTLHPKPPKICLHHPFSSAQALSLLKQVPSCLQGNTAPSPSSPQCSLVGVHGIHLSDCVTGTGTGDGGTGDSDGTSQLGPLCNTWLVVWAVGIRAGGVPLKGWCH